MKRALITGIRGFTGGYLAAELAAGGWEVWGLGSHAARPDSPSDPRYLGVDLLDQAALARAIDRISPAVVVHLAGIAFVGHQDQNAFYQVNLIGSRNLLAALAAASRRPDCVLLASSANVYGTAIGGVLDESTLPNPANDYAVSKLAMEYMARLWQDRLPLVIARPFNYTGVGQSESFLLPKIVGHFRRGAEVIELGNLDVSRDFSDVRAVVRAYRRLIEVCPVGATVNVCSGRSSSLAEVLATVATLAGRRLRVEVNPAFVRAREVKTLCGDPSRLRSLIGAWESPPLAETLGWMLEA